jgi:predicted transcriptional regulator of viral defense system
MKMKLGKQEMQMMAYLQMRKRQTVKTGELVGPLQLSREQERELFRRMSRGDLIARVRPGFYLVPERLPLGGSWSPDEALALNTLIGDRKGRYQICGPNAFNRYGFDDQISNRVYAYNNRISGERIVGAVTLTLIKVADERLGDTEEMQTMEGQPAVYGSRVRTLVDAVYDWSRFNSLPRAYDWIRGELAASRVSAAALVGSTIRYGDKGTVRRIGALLEMQGIEERLLRKLEKILDPSTGLIPWIPTRPKRGTISRRWGVVLNEKT